MTRKLQDPRLEDGRSRKRHLKPVVEKKRRDRINQSLAQLRSLLLKLTSDPRLQNPKIEKAEILDLAVEFLQNWADGKNLNSGYASVVAMESAGFHQCLAQLTNYMHRVAPAQRMGLMEGLKHHTEGRLSHNARPDFIQKAAVTEPEATKRLHAAAAEPICTSERREESPKLLFPSHSPFQPHACSTPCHDYLSPPPSPWLSPTFSPYATSPSFPSFASHFSFPPSLSPLSSNTSLFSVSPTVFHHAGPPGLLCPPLTVSRTLPHPPQREEAPSNSSSAMWRPWF
ncbi:hairy-related 11 [Antennarius striatus]|uniref:hairy-related 11 n=1 Tax=Antennarius striatus TaxID=241820 RepID=UPI0035B4EF35